MRPGVEALHRHRIPRGIGVLLHYAALLGALALLVWLLVPTALQQTQDALGPLPTTKEELEQGVRNSHGLRHEVLAYVESRLEGTQTWASAVGPAVELSRKAVEILVGVLFVFAIAAYWISTGSERSRSSSRWSRLETDLRPRDVAPRRREARGVRPPDAAHDRVRQYGALALVLADRASVLAPPRRLLRRRRDHPRDRTARRRPGRRRCRPDGVLAARRARGGAVYGLRLLQDYVINPRVFGHAVGLAPLVVLVTVSAVGLASDPPRSRLRRPLRPSSRRSSTSLCAGATRPRRRYRASSRRSRGPGRAAAASRRRRAGVRSPRGVVTYSPTRNRDAAQSVKSWSPSKGLPRSPTCRRPGGRRSIRRPPRSNLYRTCFRQTIQQALVYHVTERPGGRRRYC